MKELEKSGASLEADVTLDNLKDVAASLSDGIIAKIGENIPGLSYIFKGSKIISSIKDYFLMEKVHAFLFELSKMTTDQRKALVEKINKETIYGQKFGSFILIALDRHDFAEKSTYLARACKFYERGDFPLNTFIRIKGMIENVSLEDIHRLISKSYLELSEEKNPMIYNSFLSNGILQRKFNFSNVFPNDKLQMQEVIETVFTGTGIALHHVIKDTPIDHDVQYLNFN